MRRFNSAPIPQPSSAVSRAYPEMTVDSPVPAPSTMERVRPTYPSSFPDAFRQKRHRSPESPTSEALIKTSRALDNGEGAAHVRIVLRGRVAVQGHVALLPSQRQPCRVSGFEYAVLLSESVNEYAFLHGVEFAFPQVSLNLNSRVVVGLNLRLSLRGRVPVQDHVQRSPAPLLAPAL